MRTSGIKRVKLLNDFDWTLTPKSRDKIMEFLHTDWPKTLPLVLIWPRRVGKSHIATAICTMQSSRCPDHLHPLLI